MIIKVAVKPSNGMISSVQKYKKNCIMAPLCLKKITILL